MIDHIGELLSLAAFSLSSKEKRKVFVPALTTAVHYHRLHNTFFRSLLKANNFTKETPILPETIPFIPAPQFKKKLPLSVPKREIKTLIRSSSTTSGKPSVIALDSITSERQQIALRKIMAEVLGPKRLPFIIFDLPSQIQLHANKLSSRGTAIRGFLPFMKSSEFVLNSDLEIEKQVLPKVLRRGKDPIIILGFTWILYQVLQKLRRPLVSSPRGITILHIGGWKKLQEKGISKVKYNKLLTYHFKTKKIYDVYGLTEQLGTVYIDCPQGYKHAPTYSEIIIRDVSTLEVLPAGREGFIQMVSPLPRSYPGVSILTEDIGEIIGIDNCPCGRMGTYFVFKHRASDSELRGCGDTFR